MWGRVSDPSRPSAARQFAEHSSVMSRLAPHGDGASLRLLDASPILGCNAAQVPLRPRGDTALGCPPSAARQFEAQTLPSMIPRHEFGSRRRTAATDQVYSGMTPEELENVVDDSASLTDVAREILRTELTRRGSVEINEMPPAGEENLRRARLGLDSPLPGPAGSTPGKGQPRVVRNRVLPDRRQHGPNGLVYIQLVGRR